MARDWFAEVYKAGSIKADSVKYFDEFDDLLRHVRLFKQMAAATDTLRIHVPAKCTDAERVALMGYGAIVT